MNNKKLEKRLMWLKALSDVTRFKVLEMLVTKDRPVYVDEMIKKLKIDPTGLSHHLRNLKNAGILTFTRDGHRVLYAISPLMLVYDNRSLYLYISNKRDFPDLIINFK